MNSIIAKISARRRADEHAGGACVGKCPMDALLRLLMGPWTTYIVWVLETEGVLRFGELKSRMTGISSKVLTERLRHLEGAGIISRTYKPSIPPSVSYALTARGHELKDALGAINAVALKWQRETMDVGIADGGVVVTPV
jgi:DNA-binding HxlR family transcriptional regulator